MANSLMRDAFDHHVWASLTLIDVCLDLTPEQLATSVPGTYGSIVDTVRHLVGADASYLLVTSGGAVPRIDEESMTLPELRTEMATHGAAWNAVLDADPDPATVLTRDRDDGTSTDAPVGIRLAQVVHHGTDHRSQICTALTALGVEPPYIDVWDYGLQAGTVIDHPAS
ncbi:MAG: DinB family protein [Actinomycetota bacterium]|jgi:uncharacterized damage-inducible protein DinB